MERMPMTVESGDGRRHTMGCNLHQSRKNCRLGKSLVSFRKLQILSVVFPTGTHHNKPLPSCLPLLLLSLDRGALECCHRRNSRKQQEVQKSQAVAKDS